MTDDNVILHDPTAATPVHDLDDRFIPLRAPDLITALAHDHERFGIDTDWISTVAAAVMEALDREFALAGRDVLEHYVRFSPDRDTYPLCDMDRYRTPEGYAELDAKLAHALGKANFEELEPTQIDAAVRAASAFGIRVRLNTDRIHSLSVWVRGRALIDRYIRSWRRPIRGTLRRMEVYRRLVMVARLRDDPHVHVKVFKDIPMADVEALLPHAEVRMTWFDRLMVMSGGAGTLGTTAAKMATGAKWVLSIGAIVAALGQLVWVLIGGLFLLTFRTFMGYRRARINRDSQRTRHLYYQNISNNLGAVSTLLSMIGQEEEKEAILAYAFCHVAESPVRSVVDLAERVNAYLKKRFSLVVSFDADDAIRTLRKLELIEPSATAADGRSAGLRVLPPDAAIAKLNELRMRPRPAAIPPAAPSEIERSAAQ